MGDSCLVIGATENSGLRLAYRIDKIKEKDTNTGEVLGEWAYAFIDAHTGELLAYPQMLMSLSEPSTTIHQNSFAVIIRFSKTWVTLLCIIFTSLVLLVLLIRRRKQ